MKTCLTLFLLASCLTGISQQTNLYTWSPVTCARCQSTIVYQAWYPDGSPLVAEGMSGTNAGVLVALSLVKNTLVLSLGLSISGNSSLNISLKEAVTVETDTSSHMVLYALKEPGSGFHKDDVAFLRSFDIGSLELRPFAPASGFLFFPFDSSAKQFVVVVKVGSETFRFPFAQDATMRAKFEDPAMLVARNDLKAAEPTKGCTKNVSIAVSDRGQLVARAPEFTQKWLEKNGLRYPGLCFSQTPNPNSENYLVAFGPSPETFDGFHPLVSALSDGGVNAGTWAYQFTGTAGGATSTFISLPFSDKTRSSYAFTYNQKGELISQRQRAVTSRRGVGLASNLGVGVAAAIAASQLKEHLLADAVNDLTR